MMTKGRGGDNPRGLVAFHLRPERAQGVSSSGG